MHIAGDQDVRIDITNTARQITGLDLDGDGVIENNGAENALNVKPASGYAAVDAYTRLTDGVVDETNLANVFLGDIKYDGTGYAGDGVSTDGNVVLGGLGADILLGGIGNDFFAAGGVAQSRVDAALAAWVASGKPTATFVAPTDSVSAGRNADFIFAELSLLSSTDGNGLFIDGGATADNTSAANGQSSQDSDWLLLQASDDDERIEVVLTENAGVVGTTVINDGTLSTRAGQYGTLRDIENLDASGNTYGFIKGLTTTIGGAPANANNNGIGSSGQLNVTGSSAANIIIGGYDNDAIDGGAGNDILMGGNLSMLIDPNLVGLVGGNDGIDVISGGTGNDAILLELDTGTVAGDEGNDTLFLTNFTAGSSAAPLATEATSLDALLADDLNDGAVAGRIRLDLGYEDYRGYRGDTLGEYTDHSDEANATSTSNHVAGTADQSNYKAGKAATTVTGIENVIATGLGQIDYLAAGGNTAADLTFANQQNFFASNANLELRGTDGEETIFLTQVSNGGLTAAAVNTLYAEYLSAFLASQSSTETITLSVGGAQVNVPVSTVTVTNLDVNGDPIAATAVVGGAIVNVPPSVLQSITTLLNPLSLADFQGQLTSGGVSLEQVTTTETAVTVSTGNNTLYASTGDDILEGRSGNDLLSGGAGNDDFVFQLANSDQALDQQFSSGPIEIESGDGVDVIHRQTDAEINATGAAGSDNIWDGTFERDFGLEPTSTTSESVLKIDITKAGGNAAGDELNDVVNFVSEITSGVLVNGAFVSFTLNTAAIKAATTYQGLTDAINVAIDTTTAFGTDLQASLQADGHSIFITDTQGRELADAISEVAGAGVLVNQKANTQTANLFQYGEPAVAISEDRIIYKAYNDRAMNEGQDDDATLGNSISLGTDSYAEDLVIDFSVENGLVQTRIAEDQSYTIKFADLKVEDIAKVEVNGVIYELQVGVNLNGTLISGGESNNAFVARLSGYINSFMDDDTAAGAIDSSATGNTLTLVQRAYNGEETVFMKTPVVTLTNLSGGQVPAAVVTNTSSHEVHLLDFDGQNGTLNAENVLFVGEEFINRAVLETAKSVGGALVGSEAMVIDGGANDLAGIAVNLATDIQDANDLDDDKNDTEQVGNFSVHGDDFLLGSTGSDQITTGTGDDRVEGSLNTDTINGGKNYYAIKVLGEAESRVVVMNEWEAANPAARVTTLSGLSISNVTLIAQTEDGEVAVSGDFNDTLVFQQADFRAGVTDFTVKLDGFTAVTPTATVRTVEFRNDGAGHVETDLNGDNVIGSNITTFSNFENIRTVSGINRAVAGNGQGNDTLDVSALSNATFGVSYDLTGNGTAGDVRFTTDDEVVDAVAANASTAAGDRTVSGNYTEAQDVLVIKVDGVENVIGGTGDDLLLIDETEAAKNNSFNAGAGTDRIEYLNNYSDAIDGASEPTVTITVGTGIVDTVSMTEGALGLVVATDTLTNVEYVALAGNTAEGLNEDDVLDVTAFTSGVVVDYSNGEVRTGQAEGSGVQLVIEGMVELENVWADGNDTVIVADAADMNDNARSDENDGTDEEDIELATYLDYDATETVTTAGGPILVRKSFADQVADDEATQVINQNQFTFDMSRVGVESDVDTIDYSHEEGQITAVVNFVANDNNKYVLVDGNAINGLDDAESRIDHLISVERIVAAQGENSTIDLTNSDRDVNVVFSYNMPEAKALFVEGVDKIATLDRQINTVRVSDADDQASLGNVDLIEYRDLGDKDTGPTAITQVEAVWESVQGSDNREYVQLTQWEDGIDHVFNLRGGQNEVNYNERTNGIWLNISSVDATIDGIENQFDLTVTQLDEVGGTTTNVDTIRAFNTENTFNEESGVRLDTLRIEASQGDMDLINVANLGTSGIFLLGEVETSGSSVVTATFNGQGQGLTMSGFEFLWDAGEGTGSAPIDDTYIINDLTNFVSKLTLIDYDQQGGATFTGSLDRDTLKLTNGAFESAAIRAPISHTINVTNALHMGDGNTDDLQWLGVSDVTLRAKLAVAEGAGAGSVGFDFQVLDISEVTATATGGSLVNQITAAGSAINADDELVVGNLALLNATTATAITNFDILSLTGAGASYDFDLGAGQLQTAANVKIVGFDGDMGTLDLSRMTSSSVVTVTSTATAAAVIGTAFADTITGGAGADTITGGAGADILDGNIVPTVGPVISYSLNGGAAVLTADGNSVTILGIEVQADTTPATPTLVANAAASTQVAVAVGADADTVGSAFANVSLALWKAALTADIGNFNTLTVGEIAALESVTYNALDNRLILTFADSADSAGIAQADLGAAVVSGGTITATLGNALDNVYTPQGDSVDTFVFEAATDSTAAAMDLISNFNIDAGVGLVNDVINISAITSAPMAALSFGAAFDWTTTEQANYAALEALATAAFVAAAADGVGSTGANQTFGYAGSTGTATVGDSYLFLDADQSGTIDSVVKLVGVANNSFIAGGFDSSNIVY